LEFLVQAVVTDVQVELGGFTGPLGSLEDGMSIKGSKSIKTLMGCSIGTHLFGDSREDWRPDKSSSLKISPFTRPVNGPSAHIALRI